MVRTQTVGRGVFVSWLGDVRYLHSFPTRRSAELVLGDLNAEPDAPELRDIYAASFVDVLAATGQGDVFTSWNPTSRRRIDYIFLTPDLSPRRAWVVMSRASDHLPVLVEVEP